MHHRPTRTRTALLAVALVASLAGCSAGGSTRTAAVDAASDFAAAIADHGGAEACALLVPDARQAVTDETHRDCADGVLDLDLPTTVRTASTEVYGRAAFVRGDGDALFLARSGSTWLVRAAGCTPVPDAPFDCVLDGS
ncbi:hypothetical protein E9228_001632 [Curtobacterium flaccumfaciens]|uniref:Lipoprotein n=1 Tax=Curtobacterium salicis TaxID=1779862 RepID=A0ABX0T679_9MICO|nr:hypothetical protein [Curtobacterium sp. WW7]NII40996.1 hypothetical protein [Curtobacterium sp. WW7]